MELTDRLCSREEVPTPARPEPPTSVVSVDNSSEGAVPTQTPRRRLSPDGEPTRERLSYLVSIECFDVAVGSVTDVCSAEQEGEKDAQVEGEAPQTPAPEAEEAAPAAAAEPEEPEEITKSYDEYLAERAASQLAGLGKKEGRQVNSETLEGTQFRREAINDFFHGKVCPLRTKPFWIATDFLPGRQQDRQGLHQGQEGEGLHRVRWSIRIACWPEWREGRARRTRWPRSRPRWSRW